MSEVGKLSDVGHLTPEVVAALVDGELSRGAEHRARIHLVHCEECRDEVRAQRQASDRLRGSIPMDQLHASGSLLSRLVRIPDDCAQGGGAPQDALTDSDAVGIDGCRRPDSITGRMAAAARKVQRRTTRGRAK
ncbi:MULTISPECIES: anti-sigma factor [Corynebacterium]|uniref:anti-sigma factor n=1 Tax=Corynebacterium TaxID=1716 RepID=UPI0011AB7498|nr:MULTISPECIES: anti-sigma factor [Corynebacterium]MDN5682717.1 anti-sigma factor [Corynebacterium glyciniphilum]MDN6705965.1 anti-sigma factor [Corynebacterium glyciniphilum]